MSRRPPGSGQHHLLGVVVAGHPRQDVKAMVRDLGQFK